MNWDEHRLLPQSLRLIHHFCYNRLSNHLELMYYSGNRTPKTVILVCALMLFVTKIVLIEIYL